MGIELTLKEKDALKMFRESKENPQKYSTNDLVLMEGNKLIEAIDLSQKGLVSRTTDKKTDKTYFSISKKGLDYISTL